MPPERIEMFCVRCKANSLVEAREPHPICPRCYLMEAVEIALIDPNGETDA